MIGEEVIAVYGDAGDGEVLFEVQKLVRCKECRYKDMEICPMYRLVVAGVRKYDDFCSYGERKGGRVMKNADVIRQMTDDELYRFLETFEVGDIDYSLTSCNWCGEDIDCATCFRRWLFGDANDYKGLLADKGINSGYADRKTDQTEREGE